MTAVNIFLVLSRVMKNTYLSRFKIKIFKPFPRKIKYTGEKVSPNTQMFWKINLGVPRIRTQKHQIN